MPNAARKAARPPEVQFLRERVVALETRNAELTHELLALRREGWAGAMRSNDNDNYTHGGAPPTVVPPRRHLGHPAAGAVRCWGRAAIAQFRGHAVRRPSA